MLLASTRPGRVKGLLLNDIGPQIDEEGLARIRDYVGQGRSFPTWMHAARWLAEDFANIYPNLDMHGWLTMSKRLMKVTGSGRIVLDYDMRIAEPFAIPGGEAGMDLWPAFDSLGDTPLLLVRGENSDILSSASAAEMQKRQSHMAIAEIANTGHAPTLDEPEARHAISTMLAQVEAAA